MIDKSMLKFFFEETTEHIEQLEQLLVELEKNPKEKETIQSIFRLAHSIKGSAASIGFNVLKELTHQIEFLLDAIRQEKMDATHEVIDVLFESLDHLNLLKEEYENEQDPHNVQDIIEKIQHVKNKNEKDVKNEENIINAVNKKKEEQTWGFDTYKVIAVFKKGSITREIRMHLVKKEAQKLGEVLHIDKEELLNEEKRELVLFTKAEEKNTEEVEKRIGKILDIEKLDIQFIEAKKEKQEENKKEKMHTKTQSNNKKNQSIRVDVEKIENLMNMVGEIIIDQTMVSQMNSELKENLSLEIVANQERAIKHLSRVISEFQESVMKIRMLPVEQLYSRFPRIVRDLSTQLDKDIELILEGGDTELDRSVIEELIDPMTHIIRNSIDHGVESKEDRIKAGKKEKGYVKINAEHKDNQIVITVEDDGAGIDSEVVKEKAIQKGIITKEQGDTMSMADINYLIFHAGFSTAKIVSDVSGRGVGMDVVRNHIEKLNGIVELNSVKGKGTKIIIKLPLTLAILKGFIVELQGKTHAIPMNSVVEIFNIKDTDIQVVGNQRMVKIRENTIPLCWSNELFDYETKVKEKNNMIVMLLAVADKRLGLVVDNLIGNQEIVVKTLGGYIGKVPGISGSTILGNGRVALILDVASLFKIYEKKGR